MSVLRWKPFGELLGLQGRMNRLFDDEFFKDWEKQHQAMSSWVPSTDVLESKDDYVFKMELPGLDKEEIKIELDNNILTVKGEKKEEKEQKGETYHRIERCSGVFSRSFNIPKNVDPKKIKANMKNGVLELHIPKAEDSKPKSIPIVVQ
jgi:HSP20 family protein